MSDAPLESQRPPEPASDAPLCVVFNPRSGKHEDDAIEAVIARTLDAAQRRYRLFRIEDPRRIRSIAREALAAARADGGILVAVGGDGTLNAVAQEVLGQRVAFGVVPQGTFNYFGRVHGIAQDAAAALEALLRAQPRAVQVGQVNGRIFLVNASLGLYPKLLEDREAYKQQYGRSRWVALCSGLLTLMRERRQMRLRIETGSEVRVLRTPTLFVGNNALQLERIGIAEAGCVGANAGLLAAILVKPISTLAMLGLALRGALGRLGDDAQVETFAFRRLVVNPTRPRRFKVAFDGEIAILHSPFTFEIAPHPLWLMMPAPEDRVAVE